MRKLLAFACFMLMCASAQAATVNQVVARISNERMYEFFFGPFARIGSILDIRSDDNWRTARLQLTVSSNLMHHDGYPAKRSVPTRPVRSGYFINGLFANGDDLATARIFLVEPGGSMDPEPLWQKAKASFYLKDADKISLHIGHAINGVQRDIWDVLVQSHAGNPLDNWQPGLRIEQSFFGSEFGNVATIRLEDRSIDSYRFFLADAARVPVPASFWLGATALGFLAAAKRRRASRRVTRSELRAASR